MESVVVNSLPASRCSHKQCQNKPSVRVHYEILNNSIEQPRELCNDHYEIVDNEGLQYYQKGVTKVEVIHQ